MSRSAILLAVVLAGVAGQASGAQTPRRLTVTLVSLESNLPPVEATFNPKEVSIGKRVSWTKDTDSTPEDQSARFAGAGPRTLDLILILFDQVDVRPVLERLEGLAKEDEQTKRPPRVKVVWSGGPSGGLPDFQGVIESIGTKYTMFSADGTPARATVNLRMREAGRASGARPCKADQECPDGQSCISLTCQER